MPGRIHTTLQRDCTGPDYVAFHVVELLEGGEQLSCISDIAEDHLSGNWKYRVGSEMGKLSFKFDENYDDALNIDLNCSQKCVVKKKRRDFRFVIS